MRTRFLSTDYFAAQSPIETLRGFHPLSLPAPHIAPSDPLLSLEIPCFDLEPRLHSLVDRFPIEDALSQFLSDVVPRFQHRAPSNAAELERSRSGVDEIDPSEVAADFVYGESEIEVPERSELKNGIQFEVVEVELPPREPASSCEAEESGIRFEVPDVKIPLDIVDIELGLTFSYPHKFATSIYSVEDILAKFNEDQQCFFVKDGASSPGGLLKHAIKLRHFEVSELSLELDESLSMEEAFNFLLPKIEPRHDGPNDELVVNEKEFLGSTDIDVLEHFSGYATSKDCIEYKAISLNSVLDMDLIHINDNMLLEKNSVIYPVTSDGDCLHLPCSVQLLEVQIFDFPSVSFSQRLDSLQTAEELEMSQMFKEDMDPTGCFYESIVSSELALVDDTFKSLPAPVICDDKALKAPNAIIGDILSSLKSHPLSACDGIYLDWHPLLEGACNREICSTYMSMLEEVSGYRLNSELLSAGEEIVAIDFDFLDDSLERLNMLQCSEVPIELKGVVPRACDPYAKSVTEMCKDELVKTDNEEKMPIINAEKVSFLFESMSQSNNLNFFLDVRRGTARSCEDETRNKAASRGTPPVVLSEEPVATHAPTVTFEKWDIEVHQVNLSDHILCLMNHIQKSYLAILENDTDLRKISSLQVVDDIELLSLPKQKLLELITQKDERQFSGYNDENVKAFVALYAIKQLTYFLCFFGVHTAQLYLSNIMRSLDYLTVRLRPLESLIESACWKAEKQLIESHPSLSIIEGLLRSNFSQNGKKILVVAERVFWLPLNLKLTSLKIKIYEVKHTHTLDALNDSELTNTVLDALLHSDCLLASHEHVSASFPFNKFSIILEYGGSYASSRISSISPDLDGLPRLHFLKVKMENNSLPKALCEGFNVSRNPKFTMEGVPQSMSTLQGRLNNQRILGILNFVPTEEKNNCISSESANQVDASCDSESAVNVSYSMRSKNMNSSTSSFPDVVVVVNTQSFEKNMLISRRSSYQKILAMEKGGVQVVEREVNLPLDLIFSAAVCLVWYETRNIGDSTAATVETSSIHMFMENIATNILMSLSFAFRGCVLIFEGESSFLAAIMESSDALYAAAASLDMNLQLFCSYMPESTDEIILSCIRNATRLNTGLFPAMPESETLGESFLTRFPSVNPLSAHAILSSGGMLVEYLEWSPERRIQAIGKYHVSGESISLFSTLCRFGEIGESKSVMTECSSIDSEVSSEKLQSQRKRQKYAASSHTLDMMFDDSLYVEPLNGSDDGIREVPQVSQPYRSRKIFNVQDIPNKTQSDKFSINVEVLGRNRGGNTSMTSSFDKNGMVGYKYIDEKFSDKVLDRKSTFLDEKFPSIPGTTSFLGIPESQNESKVRNSLPASRLAFGTYSRTFPTSAEINRGTNKWTSSKDQNQSFEDKMFGRTAIGSNREDSFVKAHEDYLKEKFVQEGTRNVLGITCQEKPSPLYGKYPYSNTIKSSRKRGPQRSIEFLHIMEKSRMHQETLPCNTCLSCPESLKNKDIIKRQSPSTIDSFRYQGGGQTDKIMKQKRRKGVSVQLNSNIDEGKDSSFTCPSWTPIDKRARQNLSFTRNGNEKQSKLVWRNRKSPCMDSCTRKRFRDEG